MAHQTNDNKREIKAADAIGIYLLELELPESIRLELRERMLQMLGAGPHRGGGILIGKHLIEARKVGSEYYVDAEAFNYALEKYRSEKGAP